MESLSSSSDGGLDTPIPGAPADEVVFRQFKLALRDRCRAEGELLETKEKLKTAQADAERLEKENEAALKTLQDCRRATNKCKTKVELVLKKLAEPLRQEARKLRARGRNLPWEEDRADEQLRKRLSREESARSDLLDRIARLENLAGLISQFKQVETKLDERISESQQVFSVREELEEQVRSSRNETMFYQRALEESGCKLGLLRAKGQKRFRDQQIYYEEIVRNLQESLESHRRRSAEDIGRIESVFANDKSNLLKQIEELKKSFSKERKESASSAEDKLRKTELEWKLKVQTLEAAHHLRISSLEKRHESEKEDLFDSVESEWEAKLERLRNDLELEHDNAMHVASEAHQARLDELGAEMQEALEDQRCRLNDEFDTALSRKEQEHRDAMQAARSEWEAILQTTREERANELERAREVYNKALAERAQIHERALAERAELERATLEERVKQERATSKALVEQQEKALRDEHAQALKQRINQERLEHRKEILEIQAAANQRLMDVKTEHQNLATNQVQLHLEEVRTLKEAHEQQLRSVKESFFAEQKAAEQEQTEKLVGELQNITRISEEKLHEAETRHGRELKEQFNRLKKESHEQLRRAKQSLDTALKAQALELENKFQRQLLASHKEHDSQLCQVQSEHDQRLANLKAELAAASQAISAGEKLEREARMDQLQQSMKQQEQQHCAAMDAMRLRFDRQLDEQAQRHQTELQEASKAHGLDRHEAMQQKVEHYKALAEKFEKRLEGLSEGRGMEALRVEFERKLMELGTRHQEELAQKDREIIKQAAMHARESDNRLAEMRAQLETRERGAVDRRDAEAELDLSRALRLQAETHEAQLAQLRQQSENAVRENMQAHKDELIELERRHTREMEQTRSLAMERLDTLQQEKDALESALASIRQEHEDRVCALQRKADEKLEREMALHQDRIEHLEREHQAALNASQVTLKQKIKEMETHYLQEIAKLNLEKNDELVARQEKLESKQKDFASVVEEKVAQRQQELDAAHSREMANQEAFYKSMLQSKDEQHATRLETVQNQHEMALQQQHFEFQRELRDIEEQHKDAMSKLILDAKAEMEEQASQVDSIDVAGSNSPRSSHSELAGRKNALRVRTFFKEHPRVDSSSPGDQQPHSAPRPRSFEENEGDFTVGSVDGWSECIDRTTGDIYWYKDGLASATSPRQEGFEARRYSDFHHRSSARSSPSSLLPKAKLEKVSHVAEIHLYKQKLERLRKERESKTVDTLEQSQVENEDGQGLEVEEKGDLGTQIQLAPKLSRSSNDKHQSPRRRKNSTLEGLTKEYEEKIKSERAYAFQFVPQ